MFCSKWFGIYFTSSLFGFFAFATNCYYPDGSQVLETDYQPCVLISGVGSMCCATNRHASSQDHPDTCLSNGLCHNPCTSGGDCSDIPGRYWRESCTDPSWESSFCLKGVCINNDVS